MPRPPAEPRTFRPRLFPQGRGRIAVQGSSVTVTRYLPSGVNAGPSMVCPARTSLRTRPLSMVNTVVPPEEPRTATTK
ncbi:hypothetical protein A8924_5602 [Saccharopolyspora erythraea NRRL 2338]|nr:hypothetical protein A8924_5602 [Saccharopolyspora erythraea NRRL 2338]